MLAVCTHILLLTPFVFPRWTVVDGGGLSASLGFLMQQLRAWVCGSYGILGQLQITNPLFYFFRQLQQQQADLEGRDGPYEPGSMTHPQVREHDCTT